MRPYRPARREIIRLRFLEPSPLLLALRAGAFTALGTWAALAVLPAPSEQKRAEGPAPVGTSPERASASRAASPPVAAYLGDFTAPPPPIEHPVTDPDVRRAVLDAGEWLVRHQFPEGCWDAGRFYFGCSGVPCAGRGQAEYETGVTALATLAILRSGACDFAAASRTGGAPDLGDGGQAGRFTRAAQGGLDDLLRAQDGGGAVGPRGGARFLYGHALAALAFCEGYRWSGDARYRAAARRALCVLEAARAPCGGWRYAPAGADADTSVTGWALDACQAAAGIGLPADPDAARAALGWVDHVTDPLDFRVGYTRRGSAGASLRGVNDHYGANETCTAIGLFIRGLAGETASHPAVLGGIRRLARDLPRWEPGRIDFYYWYHGTRALAGLEAAGGPCRRAWAAAAGRALVAHQVWETDSAFGRGAPANCARGSWDPVDKWGAEGGRVYATALNALTLEALLPP